MFDQLLNNHVDSTPVTMDNYKEWRKAYTFDALKGFRFGQSFCKHFNIRDFRIQYETDWLRCDRIIRSEWVAG